MKCYLKLDCDFWSAIDVYNSHNFEMKDNNNKSDQDFQLE